MRKDALVLISYYYGCKKTHDSGVNSGVLTKSRIWHSMSIVSPHFFSSSFSCEIHIFICPKWTCMAALHHPRAAFIFVMKSMCIHTQPDSTLGAPDSPGEVWKCYRETGTIPLMKSELLLGFTFSALEHFPGLVWSACTWEKARDPCKQHKLPWLILHLLCSTYMAEERSEFGILVSLNTDVWKAPCWISHLAPAARYFPAGLEPNPCFVNLFKPKTNVWSWQKLRRKKKMDS